MSICPPDSEEDYFWKHLNASTSDVKMGPAFMQLPAWDDDKGWANMYVTPKQRDTAKVLDKLMFETFSPMFLNTKIEIYQHASNVKEVEKAIVWSVGNFDVCKFYVGINPKHKHRYQVIIPYKNSRLSASEMTDGLMGSVSFFHYEILKSYASFSWTLTTGEDLPENYPEFMDTVKHWRDIMKAANKAANIVIDAKAKYEELRKQMDEEHQHIIAGFVKAMNCVNASLKSLE